MMEIVWLIDQGNRPPISDEVNLNHNTQCHTKGYQMNSVRQNE